MTLPEGVKIGFVMEIVDFDDFFPTPAALPAFLVMSNSDGRIECDE